MISLLPTVLLAIMDKCGLPAPSCVPPLLFVRACFLRSLLTTGSFPFGCFVCVCVRARELCNTVSVFACLERLDC